MSIWIDVTDTLDVVAKKGAITGIQRVVIELVRHKPQDAKCIVWSRSKKAYRVLPDKIVQALVSLDIQKLQHFQNRTFLKKVQACFIRSFKARRADTVILPGLSWVRHKVRPTLKQMHKNGARIIVLIHDMIPFDYPEFVSEPSFSQGFRDGFRDIMPSVSLIIANSQETKKRVAVYLHDPIPCEVVPLAHEHIVTAAEEPVEKLGAFVLCVGTIEIRKNHLALLNAWQKMNLFSAPKLVFVGNWGWGVDTLRQKFEQNKFLERVVTILPDTTDAQLSWLYKNALFTVLPSHYEGWGLPVGESLWYQTPVVCTPNGALPEVHDKGIIYAPIENFGKECQALLDTPDTLKQLKSQIDQSALRTWKGFSEHFYRTVQNG